MANTFPNGFSNVLRGGDSLRVIDVLRDIILPEFASQGLGVMNNPILQREPLRTSVPPNDFVDIEANRVRFVVGQGESPIINQPGGGSLPDVTWAFNQASGARPARWEVATRDDVFTGDDDPLSGVANPDLVRQVWTTDPVTGARVYSRNEALPSLNRLPGIIIVPVGLFPILGTIRLFNGQVLMGVSKNSSGSDPDTGHFRGGLEPDLVGRAAEGRVRRGPAAQGFDGTWRCADRCWSRSWVEIAWRCSVYAASPLAVGYADTGETPEPPVSWRVVVIGWGAAGFIVALDRPRRPRDRVLGLLPMKRPQFPRLDGDPARGSEIPASRALSRPRSVFAEVEDGCRVVEGTLGGFVGLEISRG